MTQRILTQMFKDGVIFKPELIEKVNPNLLNRLWLSKKTSKVLVYKTKFGLTLIKKQTSFGVYQEILHPSFTKD